MKDELPPVPEPLPRPVVDSHCHLDVADEVAGLGPVDALDRAAEVNITRIVQVGCDLAGSRWAAELAAAQDRVVAAVAIHPNDAARLGLDALDETMREISRLAEQPRVRAVGETGLDYFRTRDEVARAEQQNWFAAHIQIAKQLDRTLVIHDRDAHDDILAVLDSEGVPDRVVMHCFSGDADFARACLDRGAWLSFPGPVTYKANAHLREALQVTPDDRLLTETDAPFLVPVPWRGYPNASYLIPHTVRFMAEQREQDLDELCDFLYQNAFSAFGGQW